MAAKFPNQLYAFLGADGKMTYHEDLRSALTAGGREVAIYQFVRARRGKLVAEWEPDPVAPVVAQPVREEIA